MVIILKVRVRVESSGYFSDEVVVEVDDDCDDETICSAARNIVEDWPINNMSCYDWDSDEIEIIDRMGKVNRDKMIHNVAKNYGKND